MTRERVEDLIARVMAEHPSHATTAAQLRYFEAVHQELAPLARELEKENDTLRETMQAQWRSMKEQTPKHRTVYRCPTCPNVYRGGDKDITVYAEDGVVWCRKCNPRCTRAGVRSAMVETREVAA